MTESQIQREIQYRIQERIGIMCGEVDLPQNQMITIALEESAQWRIDYEAQAKADSGTD